MIVIMLKILDEVMLKTLKNHANANMHTRTALRDTQHLLALGPHLGPKITQDGRKMARDGLRWPKMARRWPKMASSWPQVGPTWVIRRSWRWLSVDDVVQK